MNINQLRTSNQIICEVIVGSTLYGLNTGASDRDTVGIFIKDEDTLISTPDEVSDPTCDTKFYSLKKFMKLASGCNPNILDILFCPRKFIIQTSDSYEYLRKNRHMFISKKAVHTFSGYAYAQIKKATGQNKKVHNVDKYLTKSSLDMLKSIILNNKVTKNYLKQNISKHIIKWVETQIGEIKNETSNNNIFNQHDLNILLKPTLKDFVYFIPKNKLNNSCFNDDTNPIPSMRFSKLTNTLILDKMDASKIDHVKDLYKIYTNGDGVIKNNQVCLKSISLDKEISDFYGVVVIHKDSYMHAVKEYDSFWEWYVNRNINRWKDQANNDTDFDSKNLYHVFRLLFSAKYIATNKEPLIHFIKGTPYHSFIMGIRNNQYTYKELVNKIEYEMEEVKELFNKSDLQSSVNMDEINKIYKKIMSGY